MVVEQCLKTVLIKEKYGLKIYSRKNINNKKKIASTTLSLLIYVISRKMLKENSVYQKKTQKEK